MYRTLVINPGSTSTKVAVFDSSERVWQENIDHPLEEVSHFPTPYSQLEMRRAAVLAACERNGEDLSKLNVIMARGGILPPLASGAYEVDDGMCDYLEHRTTLHHISNVACAVALGIAREIGVKAYIYDPVSVDELCDLARVTGLKEIKRHAHGHCLNMRAAALRYCRENGLAYDEQNIVVAHCGGGATLSLHSMGRIIDVVNDDECVFSPERAGGLPAYDLATYIFEHGYDNAGIQKKLFRGGGLTSLLGTTDAREVERRIAAGDAQAKLAYEAMALSVAKSIGKLAVMVDCRLDAIILTGGIIHSEMFSDMIIKRVERLARVTRIPGENEMQALADGACRLLSGEEKPHVFRE